jgi:hypothetical protein
MVELGGDLDLDQEPLAAERIGEIGLEHLERHLAAVLHVLGKVHGGHAAPTQLALDPIAARQCGTYLLKFQGHSMLGVRLRP